MVPPGDDQTLAQLGWRMDALEKQEAALEGRFDLLRGEIAAGFLSMRTDMKELRLVTKDLYESERDAQDARIESAVKLAMWSLGLVCTSVIAALMGLAIRLATA